MRKIMADDKARPAGGSIVDGLITIASDYLALVNSPWAIGKKRTED